jgi:hypothetical protein
MAEDIAVSSGAIAIVRERCAVFTIVRGYIITLLDESMIGVDV